MAVSDANMSNVQYTSLKKYVAVLKEPAKRTKDLLQDTLKKSKIRFSDQVHSSKSEEQNTLLLKKLDKITKQLDTLKDLQEEDIIVFALKTEQNLMAVAANPRTPILERIMARIASHKPLSTQLAKIKRKREDSESEEETPESTSTKLDKISLNNQVVKMRKDVRRAKIHIIHKLTKNIHRFRNSKATGKIKEKFERKTERLVKKIKYIKELDVDEASRFALTSTQDLSKLAADVKIPMKTQAMATIAIHKFVAAPVANFRSSYPDWQKTVPTILKKKKKKRKLVSESKENMHVPIKKSEIKSNSHINSDEESGTDLEATNDEEDVESDQMEGESDQMEGESDEEKVRHDTESLDEGDDNFFTRVSSDNENSDSSHNKGKSKSEPEEKQFKIVRPKRNQIFSEQSCIISNEAKPSKNPATNGKIKNKKSETERFPSVTPEVIKKGKNSSFDESKKSSVQSNIDSEPYEKKYKQVGTASHIKGSKSSQNSPMSEVKIVETTRNTIKDSKKKEKKTNSITNIGKLDSDKNKPKVVDPFFVTSTNEEYVTSQAPALEENINNSDWKAKNGDLYSRERKRFHSFDKIKQNNWKDDWRQNKFKNRESKPYDKPFPNSFEKVSNSRSNTLIQLGNRKERRKSLQQVLQSEKVEKLHPSWEAKKKISSLATFQGKKITFD